MEEQLEQANRDVLHTSALLQKQQALSDLLFGKLETTRQDSGQLATDEQHLRTKVSQQAALLVSKEETCSQLAQAYDQVRSQQLSQTASLDGALTEVSKKKEAFDLLERELMLLRTRHTGTVLECSAMAAELRASEATAARAEQAVARTRAAADDRVSQLQVLLKKKAASLSPYHAPPIALRRWPGVPAHQQGNLMSTTSAPNLANAKS